MYSLEKSWTELLKQYSQNHVECSSNYIMSLIQTAQFKAERTHVELAEEAVRHFRIAGRHRNGRIKFLKLCLTGRGAVGADVIWSQVELRS